jgi:hypothetical protein
MDASTNQTGRPFSVYGYKIRKPTFSEQVFFVTNPDTPGMAAEDGKIVMNPASKLLPHERQALARNEAARLFMFENKISPEFDVTPEQAQSFRGGPYDGPGNEQYMRQTIVARILSGDPSAKNFTPEQKQFADELLKKLNAREGKK